VNERIVANDIVSWSEVPYTRPRPTAASWQLFGEKYGENVRVVQIGGKPHAARWLEHGTLRRHSHPPHRRDRPLPPRREGAVAAGVRRIEAIAGLEAYNAAVPMPTSSKLLCRQSQRPRRADLEKKLDQLLTQQKSSRKPSKPRSSAKPPAAPRTSSAPPRTTPSSPTSAMWMPTTPWP
jgi:alanyl-tRNA synthetase